MRFLEAVLLALVLADLVIFRTWIPAGIGLLALLGLYLLHRREARLNAQASSPIRNSMTVEGIKRLENRFSSMEGFHTPEARACSRPSLERYFYHLRYRRVQNLLDRHARNAEKVLDMGCGFGVHTRYLQRELRVPTVGIDLDHNKLALAASRSRAFRDGPLPFFVTADAARPPFGPGCFDCILMTEVLEHLVRPREGLAAANNLLAPGGTLLLTTPSRHDLAYTLNPFLILEKLLSLVWEDVLPPYHHLHERREYDRRNPAPQYGMHFHFSRRELIGMLSENGFETVALGSFEVEVPFLPWIGRLAGKSPDRLARLLDPAVSGLEKVPILNLLGQHLVCVARKRHSLREPSS